MPSLRAHDLKGSVVVLTGATSGIGRAAAQRFAEHGSRLVLAARSADDLAEVVAECERAGARALAVPTDVGLPEDVERLRTRALERFGRIDVWVDDASVLVAGPIEADNVEEVHRLVTTNVFGPYLGSRAALRTFQEQGHGVLINMSSLLGLVTNPVVPAYVMSKFAVRGLTLSLRHAMASHRNIHVCVVMPGPVDTPLFDNAANSTGQELRVIPPAYPPERVAAAIVRCARRPRRQATVGVIGHLILVGHHLSPRLADWGVAQWSGRLITRSAAAEERSGSVFEPAGRDELHGGYRKGRTRRRLGERLGRWQGRRGITLRG
jgi:NAD(P)-dependent dehydrogenase (short-subunit alcohol dehydrogenase family)